MDRCRGSRMPRHRCSRWTRTTSTRSARCSAPKCAAGAQRTHSPAKPAVSCWCRARTARRPPCSPVATSRDALFGLASLPLRLPEGDYSLDPRGLVLDEATGRARLGARQLSVRSLSQGVAKTCAPGVSRSRRDNRRCRWSKRSGACATLVNTPTEDMGPAELAAEVRDLAGRHGASYREWVGDDLLAANFPTIHAVGRASHRAPRLVELTCGAADAPHLVLIGKGVCFDTGGLDIKPADGMRWMKKDMGGAAHAIALAEPRAAGEAAGAPHAAGAGGRERDRRQRVSAGRSDPHARRAHASRSTTPTPKAASCSAMRSRTPPSRSPT